MSATVRRTTKRTRILRAAEATNTGARRHCLTFEDQYRRSGGITIFRMFEPEDEDGYTVVTAAIRPLFDAGLLKAEHAPWFHGQGHVYLTPAGVDLLRSWEAD